MDIIVNQLSETIWRVEQELKSTPFGDQMKIRRLKNLRTKLMQASRSSYHILEMGTLVPAMRGKQD